MTGVSESSLEKALNIKAILIFYLYYRKCVKMAEIVRDLQKLDINPFSIRSALFRLKNAGFVITEDRMYCLSDKTRKILDYIQYKTIRENQDVNPNEVIP